MNEQRNFIVVFFLVFAAFWGYEYFFPHPTPEHAAAQHATEALVLPAVEDKTIVVPKDVALRQEDRVVIDTPSFSGSINLKGARFDDIVLKKYKETVEDRSPNVDLLNPENTEKPFFIEFGWVAADASANAGIIFPDHKTVWSTNSGTLQPGEPVVLRWKNPQGMVFERHITVDDHQMFTVKDIIRNTKSSHLKVAMKGRIVRIGDVAPADSRVLHEGIVGYFGGKLQEFKYDDLMNETKTFDSKGGWMGITDKYWMSALAVSGDIPVSAVAKGIDAPHKKYTVELSSAIMDVPSGSEQSFTYQLITGAKEVNLLDQYEKEYTISNLDLAVDFGWLYFLTKPMYHVLTFLKNMIGNFALAILVLTVLVKALMFPFVRKSSSSMAGMKKLAPEMERLKALYPDDAVKRNQAVMELYRKHKINPAGGCLPMLIQMPVFFSLYKVLYLSIEMRHAPFWGWIEDMSVPDPTTIFNLFGLIPWTPPAFLMIGLWPILMGGTMWLQQRLTPQPTVDPAMQKSMMLLPIFLTYLMSSFPAGLVIYWAWSNILSILQQTLLNRFATTKAAA